MRLDADQKALLERAATLSGQTLTTFVIASARSAAERTIREQSLLLLAAADAEAFIATLADPPPPSPRLLRSLARHRGGPSTL